MPDDYYVSQYSGEEIDDAIARALPGGAIDITLQNKAPAGFGGFGETLTYITPGNDDTDGSKFDALIEAKFATLPNNTTLQLIFDCYPAVSGSVFFGTLWKSSANYGVLTGWSYSGEIVRKVKLGGAWLPFEWVNPLMELGKEYRTTERYLGKPVYTQIINCGSMPDIGSEKTTSITAFNVSVVTFISGWCTYYGSVIEPNIFGIALSANTNAIRIENLNREVNSNAVMYTLVKYIKNTD